MSIPHGFMISPRSRGHLQGLALGASQGLMFGTVFESTALGLSFGLIFAAAFGGLFASHYTNQKGK